MEIFAKLGIDWRLLVFQIVNFSIVLLVLWRFLYRPLLTLLAERRRKVEESMAEAEAITRGKKEADETVAREMKRAQEKAKQVIERAMQDAEKVKTDMTKKAEAEATRIVERAKKEMGAEREKIMNEIRRDAAELAVMAAEKIVKKEINAERHAALVDEVFSQ